MKDIDTEDKNEELFTILRALSCSFRLIDNILFVEYANSKKSLSYNNISDEFYDNLVKLIKSYHPKSEVLEDKNYNTKFKLY